MNSQDRTKAERLAFGSAFSFVSMLVVRMTTLVNSIVLVRVLGLYDLGVYSIVVLTVSLASVLASFGVPQSLVKFLSETQPDRTDDAGRLLGAGVMITMAATSLAASALALVSPLLASVYNESRVESLLLIGVIGLVLNSLLSPAVATFQGFELIRELGVRNMVSAVLSVPTTLALVIVWGLEGAVLATVLNSAAAILVNVSLLRNVWRRRELSLVLPHEPIVYGKILGYAVPTVVASLLVTPVLWFTSTYLATEASFAEVGRYSVGYSLASYLLFIPTAIGVPLVPIISRLDRTKPVELPPFLVRTLRVGAFLLVPPTLLVMALPAGFLALVYGAGSVSAAPVVRVLAPALFLAGVSSIVGFGIAGKGRMWDGLLLNLSWAMVFLIGSLILVPAEAAIGLSFAYLAAYIAHFAAAMAYTKYRLSAGLRPLAMPLAIAGISFAILAASSVLLADPWRDPLMVEFVIAVTVVECLALSRRELEVLSGPLRKLILWIGPSQ